MKMKRLIPVLVLVLILFAAATALIGCGKGSDVDTSGMYQVVYDGNGGFLGNKTSTMRKVFCYPNSKIPDYPVTYGSSQYTVSSLGLAMRQGFTLLGWYTSADYSETENGTYLELKTENGYGIYEADSNGTFVYKTIADESGPLIFVFAEAPQTRSDDSGAEPAQNSYILLLPTFDEEGNALLSVTPGFYICNSEADYGDIADDALREAYAAAFATRTYSEATVNGLKGYRLFADLSAEYQELFGDFERYRYSYVPAEPEDQALDHFSLVSGYASIYDLFSEDENGSYVEMNGFYALAADGDEDLPHYSVTDRFVFTGESTAEMPRYDIVANYWNFAEDRVTEDKCEWDGEKFVLRLYAHWERKNTVYYHYENGTGQVDESTTRLLEDNRTAVNLHSGEVIGRKEIIPLYAAHTFVGWSKSAEAYDPWDFANDLFPEGAVELHLYAYYVEGTYTRIISKSGLSAIGSNPAGKYLIVNDLDLGGMTYSASPFGLKENQVFTGEILSFGKTISNFTISLTPSQAQQEDSQVTVTAAPIPVAEGAKISGLNLQFTVVCKRAAKDSPIASNKNLSLRASGLIGKAQGETATTVENCTVDLTIRADSGFTATGKFTYRYSFGDFVAVGDIELSGCASAFAYNEFPEKSSNFKVEITARKSAPDLAEEQF